MKCKYLLFSILALTLFGPSPCKAAAAVQISAQSCFNGMMADGAYPLVITIENHGRSVSGSIHVYDDSSLTPTRIYSYLVDLPAGTVKQITAYPHIHNYGARIKVDYDGPNGRQPSIVSVNPLLESMSTAQIGMIGDAGGGISDLRPASEETAGSSKQPQFLYVASYCHPEAAPDEAVGYAALSELVIGAGAERLTDDQWSAIREWVVGGGSLILLGGAGSLAYLNTPGGQRLCPETSLSYAVSPQFAFPLRSGAATVDSVAVVDGTLKAGAAARLINGAVPMLATERYGAGLVSLAAFDPLAQPIRDSTNRREIIKNLLHSGINLLSNDTISSMMGTQYVSGYNQNQGGTYSFGAASEDGVAKNPFHVQLPGFGLIAAILGAYFVIVVPITFLVLRRIGRMELAWVTTPIISVAFAFIFYLFTADLYKAGLSQRTAGIICAASGDSNAHFTGVSELFFPRGGSYQLQIPGVESVEYNPDDYDEGYSSYNSNQHKLETYDTVDGLVAPDYDVTNLSFRRFYHTQSVSLGGVINGSVERLSDGRISGSITNTTGGTISDASLCDTSGDRIYRIGSLGPGETKSVPSSYSDVLSSEYVRKAPELFVEFLYKRTSKKVTHPPLWTSYPGTAMLTGNISAMSTGPTIGHDVSGPNTTAIIVSIPIGGKGAKS